MPTTAVVLVTGAAAGLGFEIVKSLCESDHGYDIVLSDMTMRGAETACHTLVSEFPTMRGHIFPLEIDVEQDDSITGAVAFVEHRFGRLDVLVNNAGAQFDPQVQQGKMTMRDAWNRTWNVNAVGSQVMTHSFVPLLLQSSNPRLLFLSSGTSTLAGTELDIPMNAAAAAGWPKTEPSELGVPAYRSCKTGLNMMMREWHRILKNDGVKVWSISPGFLVTGLGGSTDGKKELGALDASVGGTFVRTVIEGRRDGDVGRVIAKDKVQPW